MLLVLMGFFISLLMWSFDNIEWHEELYGIVDDLHFPDNGEADMTQLLPKITFLSCSTSF